MHRFRKKSDAKRAQAAGELLPDSQPRSAASARAPPRIEGLPALPPATDFRTSLILPSLSRRFSLLRNQNGDPLPLDSVRNRLAEQRAKGAEIQISEEEEEAVIEAFSSMRLDRDSAGSGQVDLFNLHSDSAGSGYGASASDSSHRSVSRSPNPYSPSSASLSSSSSNLASSHSAPLTSSSESPSASTGRSSKRHSNNLFGSGRFHDTSYLISLKNGSTRSLVSAATSSSVSATKKSSGQGQSAVPVRALTPDNNENRSSSAGSVPSSPNDEKTPVARPSVLPPVTSYSRQLTPAQVKRASMALEAAIRGLEEDEETIIAPRSAPLSAGIPYTYTPPPMAPKPLENHQRSEITSRMDEHHPEHDTYRNAPSPYPRSGTTSPSPRIPGYIPGMHRPITPRDLDSDDQSRYSSTPRATSPHALPDPKPGMPPGILSYKRRPSYSSGQAASPRAPSPSTPRPGSRADHVIPSSDELAKGNTPDNTLPLKPSLMDRRRPASPLAQLSFRPIISRPTTPANGTSSWTSSPTTQKFSRVPGDPPRSPIKSEGTTPTHSRQGSASSTVDTHTEGFQKAKFNPWSITSPALPESPTLDRENSPTGFHNISSSGVEAARGSSTVDVGRTSPLLTRAVRSPTPNYLLQRSPPNGYNHNDVDSRSPSVNGHRSPKLQHTPSSSSSSHVVQNPLVLSPMLNSSRSSLVSTGSSYHSDQEGNGGDIKSEHGAFSILICQANATPLPAWDEAVLNDKHNSNLSVAAQEDLLQKLVGLKKQDLAVLQTQLVESAMAKRTSDALRTPQRKRRGSISRSIDSRAASPAPKSSNAVAFQAERPPSTPPSLSSDNALKAHHSLLKSVVDNLPEPLPIPVIPFASSTPATTPPLEPQSAEVSSAMRTKALAEALFGTDEKLPNPLLVPESSTASQGSNGDSDIKAPSGPPTRATVEDVEKKATAATAALKSPSQTKSTDVSSHLRRRSTKRIDPQQIGSPRMLPSSSVSVDTIPLPSPSHGPPQVLPVEKSGSKLSQRFKKLLRAKIPVPNGDEVVPWTNEPATAGPVQTTYYDPQRLNQPAIMSVPAGASSTDLRREQSATSSSGPSPPASAGPAGIKGIMARLRSKSSKKETQVKSDHTPKPPPSAWDASSSPLRTRSPSVMRMQSPSPKMSPPLSSLPLSPSSGNLSQHPRSPSPGLNYQFSYPASNRSTSRPQSPSPDAQRSPVTPPDPQVQDPDALKQFYQAASSLGVDHKALSDFLAHSSPPPTANTAWPLSGSPSKDIIDDSRAQSPVSLGRQPSTNSTAVAHARPQREDQAVRDANSVIVRRTIIYPSEAELAAIMRRPSHKRRRSSVSSAKSIQERTPTPPPSRLGGLKRFSKSSSPPVPQLPPEFTSESRAVSTIGTSGEKTRSVSTFSMYERQSEDRQLPSYDDGGTATESTPALEMLELANGEVIWNIVDSLRSASEAGDLGYDEDDSFRNRTSVWSQNSVPSEDFQMTFKEHRRHSSKGSSSSSGRKRVPVPGTNRPETKVFFSSAANIERMIESMAKGADSGSFNIVPRTPNTPGRSFAAASEAHWTVEERLEHMLSNLATPGTAR